VEHKIEEFLEMVELFGMFLNRVQSEAKKGVF
jgi:hypothetical protein